MEDRVVAIIHDDRRVLLERIRAGFGAGLWGGLYCKPRRGESLIEALVGELAERGLRPASFKQRGVLNITFRDNPIDLRKHIYEMYGLQNINESEHLRWYACPPYGCMLPDYRFWLPHLLHGEGVLARISYEHPHRPNLLGTQFTYSRPRKAAAKGA